MDSPFSDHFSPVASAYADSRPDYPAALFDWLASTCAARDLAWDCGAGSGQASIALASRFRRVIATDASAEQIAHAAAHPNVEYRVAPAERSGLDAACADLVTVAQALHWFDLDRFWPEVRRVARREALFAAWTYGPVHVEGAEADALIQGFRADIAPWWPAERRHVDSGYRDLWFPFARLEAPAFAIEVRWSVDRLLGYLRSWSSVARFTQSQGVDPVQAIEAPLREAWGGQDGQRAIRWPLTVLCGFVDSSA
jgi:SAM-dependent methyltransferase